MEPEKKSNGALVGLVVIIIILIIGAVYIWRDSIKEIQKSNTPDSANSIDTELDSDVNLENLPAASY